MAGEDPKHLTLLRTFPCALRSSTCDGPTEAHHSTHGRGMAQRAHDHEAIPLCRRHHAEFHKASGWFGGWSNRMRTDWQRDLVAAYRPKNDPGVF